MNLKSIILKNVITEVLTENEMKATRGGYGGSIQCTMIFCSEYFVIPCATVINVSTLREAKEHFERCCVKEENHKKPANACYTCDVSGY